MPQIRFRAITSFALLTLAAPALAGTVLAPDEQATIDAVSVVDPRLEAARGEFALPVDDLLPGQLTNDLALGWDKFKQQQGPDWVLRVDARSGRPSIIMGPGIPFLPGRGNDLKWADFGLPEGTPHSLGLLMEPATSFVANHALLLGVDVDDLKIDPDRSWADESGDLAVVSFQQRHDGYVVDGARVFLRFNSGNLVQFGTQLLTDVGPLPKPEQLISEAQALDVALAQVHAIPQDIATLLPIELHLQPILVEPVDGTWTGSPGAGYAHLLTWNVTFSLSNEHWTWRAVVDAATGTLLQFTDVNAYAITQGGVQLVDNAGAEVRRPFTSAAVVHAGNPVTDDGGWYPYSTGNATLRLDGRFITINPGCGGLAATVGAPGDIDLQASAGMDCNPPPAGWGGAGNTRAARTSFFHLNAIKDMSRAWLVGFGGPVGWLNGDLVANVDISPTCNGFWNGASIDLFRSQGGCTNTGDNASFIAHEFGHGLDQNDNGAADGATGEASGDVTSVIELHDACIFRNLRPGNTRCPYCPVGTTCPTGERDVAVRQTAAGGDPMRPSNIEANPWACRRWACPSGCRGPMGYECHCEGIIPAGAFWDMAQELIAGHGFQTGWAHAEKLWFRTAMERAQSFAFRGTRCVPPPPNSPLVDGCAPANWYTAFLWADDDDGNLTNGTPNGCRIHAAFFAHEIACDFDPRTGFNDPPPCFERCAQDVAPTVTAVRGAGSITLSWPSVGAPGYEVSRNVLDCSRGFTPFAAVPGGAGILTWTDTEATDGFPYFYTVAAVGTGGFTSDCQAAVSECASCAPGPPVVNAGSDVVAECGIRTTLQASATCGDCAALTVEWTGAGITFGTPNELTTTALVGDCTSYVAQVTVRCGADVRSDTVTIQADDTRVPQIYCPEPAILDCTQDGNIGPGVTGSPTVTDECDESITPTFLDTDTTPSDCAAQGIWKRIVRAWTATDDCGNASTCYQLILLLDDSPPDIDYCPPDVTLDCSANIDPLVLGSATATDDCGGVEITHADVHQLTDCNPAAWKFVLRTWTATDDCGNFSTCLQRITLTDSTAPSWSSFPSDVERDSCTGNVDPSSTGTPTATDDCSGVGSISHADTRIAGPGCPGVVAVLHRVWTVRDNCGNSAVRTQLITLRDMTPPTITCPPDRTAECFNVDPPGVPEASATDPCGGTVVSLGYSDVWPDTSGCGPNQVVGVLLRTWQAEDACGNRSECVQRITIVDTVAPILGCPADVIVDACGGSIDPLQTGWPTMFECDSDVVIVPSDVTTPGPGCPGIHSTITRTWRAEDSCGNVTTCVQVLTLRDLTPPVITCPPDVTVECSNTDPSVTGEATAFDQCLGGPVPVPVTFEDFGHASAANCETQGIWGFFQRRWIAVDACGNVSTCIQRINMVDTTPPDMICPGDRVVDACGGSTDPVDTGWPSILDCDWLPSIDVDMVDVVETGPGCPGDARLIRRTFTATDRCGNVSSCTQLIHVRDLTPPEITCPLDITVECWDTEVTTTGMATAVDLCLGGPVEVTWFDFGHVEFVDCRTPGGLWGRFFRTFTATDACGNSSSCTQTIDQIDTTPPEIYCPPEVILDACGLAPSTHPDDTGYPTVWDCDGTLAIDVQYTDQRLIGFGCPGDEWQIRRTWRATDRCGNTNTCVQLLRFRDLRPPDVNCPRDANAECGDSEPNVTGWPVASDSCLSGPNLVTFTYQDILGMSFFDCTGGRPAARFTRRWTATDECGNSNDCDQVITLFDTTPPEVTCPGTYDATGCPSVPPHPDISGWATVDDACQLFDPIPTWSDAAFLMPTTPCGNQPAFWRRTWTAADRCGNVGTCVQIINRVP